MPTEKEYKKHLLSTIKKAVSIFKETDTNHPGLNGYLREILCASLIKPILNKRISIGTGKIIDSENHKSSQQDIILYSEDLLPPILFDEKFGFFPYEATLMTIEVKTNFKKTELNKTISSSKYIDDFTHSQCLNIDGIQEQHDFRFLNFIFCFKNDLGSLKNVSDLLRYYKENFEIINTRDTDNRYLHGICVIGVGFIFFDGTKWLKVEATEDYNEIIGFLRMISDLSILGFIKKRNPFLGNYIIENEEFRISQ